MWRSRARALLLRSLHLRHHAPPKTLTLTLTPLPPPPPAPSRLLQNPRFFSNPAANPGSEPSAAGPSELGADENAASGDTDEASAWNLEQADASPFDIDDVADDVGAAGVEVPEVSVEQVETVVSVLKGGSEEAIESSLDKLELPVTEELVARVIGASAGVGENLIRFYKWALEIDESVKTSRAVELLVESVKGFPGLKKQQAYMLWDLVKELGKDKWVLNTAILNELISIFWKLGKSKAGFEVFNQFDEFACSPDGDSYYYTIQALGKRSMFDYAWSVCEKMLSSGVLPDERKMGDLVTFFCRAWKVKEAHIIYLTAKEKNLSLPRSSLDSLIRDLAKNDETVSVAFELLEDYTNPLSKDVNRVFGSVVKGLCRAKRMEEAKKLLLRMVKSGPAPRNASFNYVINALSKGGELDDAVSLMKLMEDRGLKPDVYTYTVVMSGYAKGGMMDEAYKVYCEAKKKHSKLSPATYHILTRGYCKVEEFGKAVECLKEMKESGVVPNADECNKMIKSLCLKALDWRTAEKLLEEMKESGVYVKGVNRSMVAAVREIEEEETQPEAVSIEA